MLSVSERSAAAEVLRTAERDRKQATQLSTRWPRITFEDAYAISSEVNQQKIAGGAKLIGYKVGLTSKAMQRSSQIEEPDYGYLLDCMMIPDAGKVRRQDYCVPRVEG
jgi:2-oxo-hept-3-ene-1,7-dioate hydratase